MTAAGIKTQQKEASDSSRKQVTAAASEKNSRKQATAAESEKQGEKSPVIDLHKQTLEFGDKLEKLMANGYLVVLPIQMFFLMRTRRLLV